MQRKLKAHLDKPVEYNIQFESRLDIFLLKSKKFRWRDGKWMSCDLLKTIGVAAFLKRLMILILLVWKNWVGFLISWSDSKMGLVSSDFGSNIAYFFRLKRICYLTFVPWSTLKKLITCSFMKGLYIIWQSSIRYQVIMNPDYTIQKSCIATFNLT